MERRSTSAYQARALERGLAILDALGGTADPLSLGDLSLRSEIPKSSLVRLLSVLEAAGYVVRVTDEPRYRLGPALLRLADVERANLDVQTIAGRHLRRLAHATGQTANLGVLQGTEVLHVCVEQPDRALSFRSTVGALDDTYCTGLGKALLAALPDELVSDHVQREPFRKHTEHTVETMAELLDCLALTRRRGYALDDQERDIGVRCLALPVDLPDGPRAALSINAPAGEMEPDARDGYVAEMRVTVAALQADYAFRAAMTGLAVVPRPGAPAAA